MDKETKYILFGSSLMILGYLIYEKLKSKSLKEPLIPENSDPKLSSDFNFHIIPDGKNNYRSAQFTKNELEYVIPKYGIKNIIRMNGDGNDSKHKRNYPETPISVQKSICDKYGCNFQFINSHQGYQYGKGYVGSLNKILPILKEGNTLIHCAHGKDRTGGIVGGYLKKEGYMTDLDKLWDYTTQLNGWRKMISDGDFFGSGYDKYADTFYPLDLLKKKYS